MNSFYVINVLFISAIMLVAWFWYILKKNPGVIDMFWSIAIMSSGLIALTSQSNFTWYQFTAGFLLLTWGIRLSVYLWYTRVFPGHVDERYLSLSQDWKISKALGFLVNYQFQGFLALIIALPFWWIAQKQFFSVPFILGIIFIITGIIGESIADFQLHRYKKNHDKGVYQQGLWRYSRHPNYFFEWLTWVGFACLAIMQPYGFISFLSPILLLCIMLFITVPLTEKQSLKSRGEAFKKYQKSTSRVACREV